MPRSGWVDLALELSCLGPLAPAQWAMQNKTWILQVAEKIAWLGFADKCVLHGYAGGQHWDAWEGGCVRVRPATKPSGKCGCSRTKIEGRQIAAKSPSSPSGKLARRSYQPRRTRPPKCAPVFPAPSFGWGLRLIHWPSRTAWVRPGVLMSRRLLGPFSDHRFFETLPSGWPPEALDADSGMSPSSRPQGQATRPCPWAKRRQSCLPKRQARNDRRLCAGPGNRTIRNKSHGRSFSANSVTSEPAAQPYQTRTAACLAIWGRLGQLSRCADGQRPDINTTVVPTRFQQAGTLSYTSCYCMHSGHERRRPSSSDDLEGASSATLCVRNAAGW